MDFWVTAYKNNWIKADALKGAVSTTLPLKFGQITPDQYKTITGTDYTAPVAA